MIKNIITLIFINYLVLCGQTTYLEENNEVILDGVSKVLISSNTSYFYILNLANNIIVKYDINNGNVINYYKSHIGLSDSVVSNLHKPFSHRNREWKFIYIDDYKSKFNFDVRNKSPIINYFEDIQEIDTTLYVYGLFYGYKYALDDNSTSIEPRNTVCKFTQSLILKEVVNFEIKDKIFTRSGLFFKDNQYYLQISNKTSIDSSKYYTLGLYDNLGYHKENILTLPSIYIEKNILYNLPFKPLFTFNGKELIHTYQYLDTIFIKNKQKLILKNLNSNNNDKFNNLDEFVTNKFKNFDLLYYFNFKIDQIHYYNKKLYIVVRTFNDNKEFTFKLQIYDYETYNLLNEITFSGLNLEAFSFNKDFTKIYQIYFDKKSEKYYLTNMEIEK